MRLLQLAQRLIKGQQVQPIPGGRSRDFREFNALELAAALRARLGASRLDQNSPHRLRCRREEMAATVPFQSSVIVHQSDVRLVNERRSAQGLTRSLRREPRQSQLAQLLVN